MEDKPAAGEAAAGPSCRSRAYLTATILSLGVVLKSTLRLLHAPYAPL